MKLADYLSKNEDRLPVSGTQGTETDWLTFCKLKVSSGYLWAGDPWLANGEDGCVFSVPKGTYAIEAKCMNFDGPKRISRLRVFLPAARDISLGKETGQVGTDSAMIAVCDIRALDTAIGDQYDAAQELIESEATEMCGIVELKLNGVCQMPYVQSGFGDGVGPVFQLLSGNKLVGIELEFIPSDYTFEYERHEMDQFEAAKLARNLALHEAGACMHCAGTGKCYCVRKGEGPAGCVVQRFRRMPRLLRARKEVKSQF